MNKINNVLIGTDPELFLKDKNTGVFVPSFKFFEGDKKKPVSILDPGFSIQCDNVMVEFNVPPAKLASALYASINRVLEYIDDNTPDYVRISTAASAVFTQEALDNPLALVFGCEPDFNAWTLATNTVQASDPLLRSAGGHIHIGYDNPDYEISMELVKAMDKFLGVQSISLDADTRRRELYGKAGAFRFTQYGVEYRVLSNFWIFKEETVRWVFDRVEEAVKYVNSGSKLTLESEEGNNIVNCINLQNKDLVKKLLNKNKTDLKQITI